jgi:hypothetical protein
MATLNDESAKPLLDKGWRQEGETFNWQGSSGTSMQLEEAAGVTHLRVLFAGKHALEYEMTLESPEQVAAMAAALAAETVPLGRLSHAGFSKAIAAIAKGVAVRTTEGYWVRPWIDNGELSWRPIQR